MGVKEGPKARTMFWPILTFFAFSLLAVNMFDGFFGAALGLACALIAVALVILNIADYLRRR